MSDELALLKQLGTSEPPPAHVEDDVTRQLAAAIAQARDVAPASATRWYSGWWPRVAAGVAAGAVALGGLLVATHTTAPSIADKAYAAINQQVGIMHFVQQYGLGANPAYEEYWIDLQHPSRQRIVQSSGGKVTRQLVYTGGYSSYFSEADKRHHNPLTIIAKAPPNPNGGVNAGASPMSAYRKLLRSGTVLSETKTTYDSRAAYRLVIRYTPPYKLVGNVWTGDRVTYTVDSTTYYPLELRLRPDRTMGGSPSVIRYPTFEILAATTKAQQLLKPVAYPKPYRP